MKKIPAIRLKASFTIEAAVVVPIIMIVTVALLFLSFYAHDNTVINAAAAYAALENAGQDASESSVSESIDAAVSGRLISASGLSFSSAVSDNEISSSVSADFYVPLRMAAGLLNTGSGVISVSSTVSNLDGRALLLKYKVMADGLSNLTGNLSEE